MTGFGYAVRRLGREPWFALTAVITLAIGIGACTAMFSIVQAVLLRPFGVVAPSRVVVMWPTSHGAPGEFPFAMQRRLGDRVTSLQNVALIGSVNWFGWLKVPGGAPADLPMAAVSASFFDVLAAPPLLGRTFRPADDEFTAARVLILSHGLWVRRFGADSTVIGQVVQINDHPFEIVGVMRPEFFYPRGAEFWVPAARVLADNAQAERDQLDEIVRGLGVFYAVARLGQGATIDTVRAETVPFLQSVALEQPLDLMSAGISVTALPDHIFGSARGALPLLMAAVGAVLVIASINVAGLLLTRGTSQTHEIAVRAALGAGRWTIAAELLTDSAVLAVCGAVVGITVARVVIGPLVSFIPADIPRLETTAIDLEVLAFSLALTLATTLAIGVLPALRLSTPSLVDHLKGGARALTSRSARAGTRRLLVTVQVAVTLVLLIASALCVRSFARLAQLDLGFNPQNVLTFRVRGAEDSTPMSRAEGDDLLERMLSRFQRVPQVVAVGAVNQLPFASGAVGWDTGFLLEGEDASAASSGRHPNLNFQVATADFFRAMGIQLLRGRTFTALDRADAPLVVIVSKALADRVWPGQDPIGKRLRTGFTQDDSAPPAWQTVVGMVATARQREIESPRLDIYVPFRQAEPIAEYFTLRTAVAPESLVPALAAATNEMAPGTTLDRVVTMDAVVRRTRGPWLFSATVFSLFGVVALGLSWLGLFGLVAFAVAQRTREIGVRMALGAVPRDVVVLMIRQGTGPALAGVLVGIVAAISSTRLLASLLFETSPTDLGTFAAVSVGFAIVSLLASYLPARRAAAVNPVVALRAE